MSSTPEPPAIGARIGDYVIIEPLGEGGGGRVFKVRHELTQRVEAMKFVAARRGASEEQAQALLREVQVQASLDHPCIARVHNAFWHGDDLVVAMEMVEGETVERLLSRGRIPIARAIQYAVDTLGALAYAHSRGVIHRDISARNLILASNGHIKITDFGLAGRPGETPEGGPAGTLYYAAPEQIRARDKSDIRSDLYSVGVVLYEMTTGRRPFDGESPYAIMVRHVEQPPAPPGSFNPEIPDALERAILRALEKNPEKRFPTAVEFRDALKSVNIGSPMLRQRLWLGAAAGFFIAIAGGGAWYAHSIINRPPERLQVTAARPLILPPDVTPPAAAEPPKPEAKVLKQAEPPAEPEPLPTASDLARSAGVVPTAAPVAPPVAAPKVTPPKPVEIAPGTYRLTRTVPVTLSSIPPVFSNDGRSVAVANGASVDVIDASTGERTTLGGHAAQVTSFAFSRDGSKLVSGSRDGSVKVWNLASQSAMRSIDSGAPVTAVAFSRDQMWVAAANAGRKLKAWSLADAKESRELKDIKRDLNAVAFTPDGSLTGISSERGIPLWGLDKSKPRHRFDGWDGGASVIAMSPGGDRFAAASGDRIKQFDVASGKELRHVQVVGQTRAIVFTPDGRCLAVSAAGNSARLWDIDEARQIRELPTPGPVSSVTISPSGRMAVVSGGTNLTIWDGKP